MRRIGVLLFAAAVAAGGLGLSLLVSRALSPVDSLGRPVARSFYRLTPTAPTLRFGLDPGASLIKLKLRGEGIQTPTDAVIGLQLLDADDRPAGAPSPLHVPLAPQDPEKRTAWLSTLETPLSLGTTRVLRVEAGPYGGSLEVRLDAGSPPVLVRGFVGGQLLSRGDTVKGRWYRTASQNLGMATPATVTVLTIPAADELDADAELLAGNLVYDPLQSWRSRLFLLGVAEEVPPVVLPLAESVAGILRVSARGVIDDSAADAPVGLAYRVLSDDGPIANGEVHETATIDPDSTLADAHAFKTGTLALVSHGQAPTGGLRVTLPVTRFLPLPADARYIEVTALPDLQTPVAVSFASWAGPSGGVGLEAAPAAESDLHWQLVTPANAMLLSASGRTLAIVHPRAPTVAIAPPGAFFDPLTAALETPNEIMEAVSPGAPPGTFARVDARGVKVCAPTDARPVALRLRVSDPARLGSVIKAHIGPSRVANLTLLTSALTFHLDNLPKDCLELRLEGLSANDVAFVDAIAAPNARTWARRRVWEVKEGRSVRFLVDTGAPEMLTVHAYPSAGAQLTLRVAVDKMAPQRRAAWLAERATPPLLQTRMAGGAAPELLFTTEPRVRLEAPTHLGVPLGTDLVRGRHEVSVTVVGTGRAWVRMSSRVRDLEAETTGARPP